MGKQIEARPPVSIFYSYAHTDEQLREKLEDHLSGLRRQGLITDWHDRKIVPGTDWAYTINSHLMTSSIILLLVSPAFLASDYCWSIEMGQALERHEAGEARVIPIILRPVDWKDTPFGHLQALPTNAKPVTKWSNRDEAFLDIVKGIRAAIDHLHELPSEIEQIPVSPRHSSFSTTEQLKVLPPTSPLGRQNRQYMLERVQTIWITGLLEQSLHGAALIALGLDTQPDAVVNPLVHSWRLIVQEIGQLEYSPPSSTSILEVYDSVGGELLILGEPGAGKTTLLLELTRDLLERARKDDTHPMPIVFNLSSWAKKRQPLYKWLIEELNSRYQVPRKLAEEWMSANQVLPLLDGLDEVTSEYRTMCLGAINAYRQKYSMIPTVVCSRSAEYLAQKRKVRLRCAVVVQPLKAQQIDDYLLNAGQKLAALRAVLRDDPVLQEMATTPLMLSILTLTYHGTPVEELVSAASPQIRRKQIFTTYVRRMLQRRVADAHYTSQQTIHWLMWLAKQLSKQSLTVFSIEQLHPGWLATSQSRKRYFDLIATAPIGLLSGLLSGLFVRLLFGLQFELVITLLIGLQTGLASAGLVELLYERHIKTQPPEMLNWSWNNLFLRLKEVVAKGRRAGMIFGPVIGMISGVVIVSITKLFGGPVIVLQMSSGLVTIPLIWMVVGGIAGLIGGWLIGQVISVIVWSLIGLVIGLWRNCYTHFQSCILRLLLWLDGSMPWRYSRFLDYAADHILLRKIGNEYIFIHRLLLDYFAEVDTTVVDYERIEQVQDTA